MPGCDARHGVPILCYCADCRAFVRHLGKADYFEPRGGLEVFITRPDRIAIVRGREHLACLKLTETGLERWYAGCCKTPLSSHLPGWAAMAGVTARNVKDPKALGPVTKTYCAASAPPELKVSPRDVGITGLKFSVLGWSVAAMMGGRGREGPFHKKGVPITPPRVLTQTERAALYA